MPSSFYGPYQPSSVGQSGFANLHEISQGATQIIPPANIPGGQYPPNVHFQGYSLHPNPYLQHQNGSNGVRMERFNIETGFQQPIQARPLERENIPLLLKFMFIIFLLSTGTSTGTVFFFICVAFVYYL